MRTIATLLLFASFSGAAVLAQTPVQPETFPAEAFPAGELPEQFQLKQLPPKQSPPEQIIVDQIIVDQIRGALETGKPTAAPGILGDVLEVIRQRGSILDGSALDPENDDPLKTDERPTQNRDTSVDLGTSTPKPSSVTVAESLLRSARLLESIPGGDEDRRALVRQMRIQATRLLVQTYPL